MQSASVWALLQAALSLLTLVQSAPNIPQSLQNTAIQTAQQAISLATTQLSANAATQSTSVPPSPTQYPTCTGGSLMAEAGANGSTQTVCVSGGLLDLTASPDSGPAPLTVEFTAANGDGYTIHFGDGQSGTLSLSSSNGQTYVAPTYHTYTSAGSYNVTVTAQIGTVVGTTEVTVTGNNSEGSTILSCPAIDYASVDCVEGYNAVSPGTDANGCPLPRQCVPASDAPSTLTN